MPNILYNKAKEGFLGGTNEADLVGGRIGVALVSNGYTAAASHTTMTNVGTNVVRTVYFTTATSGTGAGGTGQSSGLTITDGVFDGPDITISNVSSGGTVNAIIIFEQNATNSTVVNATDSKLVAYIDTVSSGLPINAPSSANITISWDNGDFKIFRL
jgi:hypothetical protein